MSQTGAAEAIGGHKGQRGRSRIKSNFTPTPFINDRLELLGFGAEITAENIQISKLQLDKLKKISTKEEKVIVYSNILFGIRFGK